MTNEVENSNWSENAYYAVNVFCIFNAITIVLILIKMAKVYPKYFEEIKADIFAIIVLLTIIIRSINLSLVQTEFIFAFTESCINSGANGCSRCNISSVLDRMLIFTSIIARILVFLQALQINFQRIPLLAYPRTFIIAGKIFYLLLWIALNTLAIAKYPLNPSIYGLSNDQSTHMCLQGLDDQSKANRKEMMGVFVPFLFLSHIVFCVLYIIKAVKLYNFKRDNITSTNPRKIKHGLRSLKSIIKTMVRHTILVLCITGSMLFFLIIPRLANPDGMSLDALDGIMVGFCIYMMYPFGEGLFNLIFGRCNSRLLKKWYEYEYEATYNRNVELASANNKVSNSLNNKSVTQDQVIIQLAADAANKLQKEENGMSVPSDLSTIQEDLQLTKDTTTDVTADF